MNYDINELGLLKYFEEKTEGIGYRTPVLTYSSMREDIGMDTDVIKCYAWRLERKKLITINGDFEKGATVTLKGELKPNTLTTRRRIRILFDGLTEDEKTIARLIIKTIYYRNRLGEGMTEQASGIRDMVQQEANITMADETVVYALETLINAGVISWVGEWAYGEKTKRIYDSLNARQRDAFFRMLS